VAAWRERGLRGIGATCLEIERVSGGMRVSEESKSEEKSDVPAAGHLWFGKERSRPTCKRITLENDLDNACPAIPLAGLFTFKQCGGEDLEGGIVFTSWATLHYFDEESSLIN